MTTLSTGRAHIAVSIFHGHAVSTSHHADIPEAVGYLMGECFDEEWPERRKIFMDRIREIDESKGEQIESE